VNTTDRIPCSGSNNDVPVCEHGTSELDGYINHKKIALEGLNMFPCNGVAESVKGVLNDNNSAIESRELMPRNDLIFIVDDLPVLLKTMEMILRPFKGMEIRTFSDGQKALDNISETGELPAVILTDYQMPNLDGMELCNEMKKIDASKRPFVIIATGRAIREVYSEFMEAGAFTVLQKPFESPKDVLKEVKRAHSIKTSGSES
jgi:CheY-like chemotaxis protein